jgi:PAS domain S-box-containing protein
MLDDRTARAKVNHMFSCYIGLWHDHIRECFNYSRVAYDAGIESGDFTYAGYGVFHESWHALFSGMNLEQYQDEYADKLQFLSGNRFQSFSDAHRLMLQWGRCLQGRTDTMTTLDGDGFLEQTYLENYSDTPFFIAFYYVSKLNICVLMQEYESALHFAKMAETVISGVRGMIWEALFSFGHALLLAAIADRCDDNERASILSDLDGLRERMRIWAENAPANFRHQFHLLQAEYLRLQGDWDEAAKYYEHAIKEAQEQGYVNIAALACEHAGRLWLRRDRSRLAMAYMQEAIQLYREWGADGKCRQLMASYADIISNTDKHSPMSVELSPQTLDIAALMKASQAISGEMVMDRLIGRLLEIVLENSGAEHGLLLSGDNGWHVEAAGVVDGQSVSINSINKGHDEHAWSDGVINYVSRTCDSFLSGNAQEDNRLRSDPTIRERKVMSVLCVPIQHQQQIIALLYLENNLIPHIFTPERVLVVQALAAQAAIALENARLYNDVIKEIGERKQAESALRTIALGTASVTGEGFFQSLVQSLADSLGVECAFVTECLDSSARRVATLAFMRDGRFEDNFEYEVAGTPCERVVQGEICYIPDDLESLYPCEEGFGSYLAVPALDQSGQVLGHLAILDTSDMRHLPHAESILQIFATRVGVELQRKRIQLALQASEEKYRLLVENQTDLIVKLDSAGHLGFASPSFCEMFSQPEHELLHTRFHDHIHGSDREQVEFAWNRLFTDSGVTDFEHRANTAMGERWLGWVFQAVRDSQANVIEIVGVGRDVTDRRKAEEQARQNLTALAHAGRLESMGEMASTLAHELNQPLTAILSFSQASGRVLQGEDFDRDELGFALDRIAVNARRAGDIISHMRGFIRKDVPKAVPASINRLIIDAMELINPELQQFEIDAVLELQQDLSEVSVDPVQIQQVIFNLVRNSMEAICNADVDERRITVGTCSDGDGIRVTVTDTGPGLDDKLAGDIFSTFVTNKADGMGIGLPICKSIVEAHGGDFVVRPRSGGGAIFSFSLQSDGEGDKV